MPDVLPEKDKMNKKWWHVLGLAMALPSLIVGVFFGAFALVQKGIISWGTLLIVMILVIAQTLFLMVRYGMVSKNK
jgi:hypothetical protein